MKSYSKPYRLNRNSKGWGIILYVRKDIPLKLINSSCTSHDKEYFLVELNLKKQKWLIICNYKPHKTRIKIYLAMKRFCQKYNFKYLLDKPTWYKTPTNPSCVDLILRNRLRSFQNSCTFEIGLSEFHKMTLTVLKSSFAKQKPRILNYRNCKYFNNTLLLKTATCSPMILKLQKLLKNIFKT